MATQPRFMTHCEIRLAMQWYHEHGVAAEEIGRRLRRNRSCIWVHPGADDAYDRGRGRKALLPDADMDALVKLTEDMQYNECWQLCNNYITTI